ncbi:MAG TPA: biopolymer transporter ExbD [Candidatus Acidoferrales bacterium]|nr:biopolymer transporter ExbD [Candidatus Acidoferrales bacterium]
MYRKLAIAIFTLAFALNLNSQQLQKGVHVQLAPTENALSVAAADEPNAWIVAVTAESALYFGADQATPDALFNDLISHPRNRDQRLFIKADADAPYSAVESALNAARRASFADCILLTAQKEMPMPGERILPNGLEVQLQSTASNSKTPIVELFASNDETPAVKINHRPVRWNSLQNTLTEILTNSADRNVVVKAEPKVSFGPVAHVIDVAHSLGSEVILR